MYRQVRAGQIEHFTGVSAPYESPEAPEIVVHIDRQTPSESTAQIVNYVKVRHIGRDLAA
jgi:adenylylsulfate kinase-like enzyme